MYANIPDSRPKLLVYIAILVTVSYLFWNRKRRVTSQAARGLSPNPPKPYAIPIS